MNKPDFNLPNVPSSILVQLLFGLRYVVQRAGIAWSYHYRPTGFENIDLDILVQRRLTLVEKASLYTTSLRVIRNWPESFNEFLDAYRKRPNVCSHKSLRDEFGALYSSWLEKLWNEPNFEFIQIAFNEYLMEHVPVAFVVGTQRAGRYRQLTQKHKYIPFSEAAARLKMSNRTLRKYIDAGYVEEQQGSRYMLLIEDIEQIEQLQSDYLMRHEVEDVLGLGPKIVDQLLKRGFLTKIPDSKPGTRHRYISRESVEVFLGKLKQRINIRSTSPEELTYISEAAWYLARLDFDFGRIIALISEGNIQAYHDNESLLPLNKIYFFATDLATFTENYRIEKNTVNLGEAAAILGMSRSKVLELCEANLFSTHRLEKTQKLFYKPEVQQLAQEIMNSKQVAKLLLIKENQVSALAKQAILPSILKPQNSAGYYRFKYSDIVEWSKKYVLLSQLVKAELSIWHIKNILHTHNILPVFASDPPIFAWVDLYKVAEALGIA